MKIYPSVPEVIGPTPLVQLQRPAAGAGCGTADIV